MSKLTKDGLTKRWLKKGAVARRYSVVPRSIMNAVKDGRLPKPHYPLLNDVPMWLESELDEHDARAAIERPAKKQAEARAS
jgi:hypothetical protein